MPPSHEGSQKDLDNDKQVNVEFITTKHVCNT